MTSRASWMNFPSKKNSIMHKTFSICWLSTESKLTENLTARQSTHAPLTKWKPTLAAPRTSYTALPSLFSSFPASLYLLPSSSWFFTATPNYKLRTIQSRLSTFQALFYSFSALYLVLFTSANAINSMKLLPSIISTLARNASRINQLILLAAPLLSMLLMLRKDSPNMLNTSLFQRSSLCCSASYLLFTERELKEDNYSKSHGTELDDHHL